MQVYLDWSKFGVRAINQGVCGEGIFQVMWGGSKPPLHGLIPLLACCHLGALNAESFCERVISCANDVVTKLHTRLLPEIIEKIVVLRMNKTFMKWMRTENANEIVRCGGEGTVKTHKSAIPPG